MEGNRSGGAPRTIRGASDAEPSKGIEGSAVDPGICEELTRAFASGLIMGGSAEARAVVTGGYRLLRDGGQGLSNAPGGCPGEGSVRVSRPAHVLPEPECFLPEHAISHEEHRGRQNNAVLSSGFPSLDELLPAGGVRPGRLIELLLADECSGGVTLACAVAMHVAAAMSDDRRANGRGLLVVVDRYGDFYPPAVFNWRGWGRCRLVVARPSRDEDEVWAIDQALRCPGVRAVVAWPRRVHPTSMRRWQLAARYGAGTVRCRSVESSSTGIPVVGHSKAMHDKTVLQPPGGIGLIVRPASDLCRPSWAESRLLVESHVSGDPSADRTSPRSSFSWSGIGIHSIAWRITRQGAIDSHPRTADVVMDLATGVNVSFESRDASEEGAHLAGAKADPPEICA